jgi:hypothetical protein
LVAVLGFIVCVRRCRGYRAQSAFASQAERGCFIKNYLASGKISGAAARIPEIFTAVYMSVPLANCSTRMDGMTHTKRNFLAKGRIF